MGAPSNDVDTSTLVSRQHATSVLGGVTLVGRLDKDEPAPPTGLRTLESFGVVYVYDGAGFYEDANGRRMNVRAGDLILLFPTLGHRYGPAPGTQWREYFLVFEGPVFELWEQSGLLDPERPVHHLEPVDHWLRELEAVPGLPRHSGFAPSLLETCRLQSCLANALNPTTPAAGGESSVEWADRVCAILGADLDSTIDMRELASSVGLSYDGFRKRFRRIVGVPPARYRQRRVVDRACDMMLEGRMTDRQIGQYLGFSDEYHFSRRFKQVVGVSPRVYRRRLPPAARRTAAPESVDVV